MFYNKAPQISALFKKARYETFIPVKVEEQYEGGLHYKESPVLNSLLFAKTTERFLRELRQEHPKQFSIYTDLNAKEYTKIHDKEMEAFIALNSVNSPNVRFGGEDLPKYHKGDRVRVMGGQFEGYEGHITRIKGEKCLVVSIKGIAAMFVAHIHPKHLKTVN